MTQADRLLQSEQLQLLQALYGARALPDEPEPVSEPEAEERAE
jgi:hypothetical protein